MKPFFPVNTLKVMHGAVAAEMAGVFGKYVDVIYRNMWAQPKKMDEEDIILTALNEGGLGRQKLVARLQEPEVKAALIANASVVREFLDQQRCLSTIKTFRKR
jgi:2-hydroxychromene-2-carboxylate isomerase